MLTHEDLAAIEWRHKFSTEWRSADDPADRRNAQAVADKMAIMDRGKLLAEVKALRAELTIRYRQDSMRTYGGESHNLTATVRVMNED